MKSFAKWVVIQILWPILRELLADMLKQLIKLMAVAFKELLAKWLKRDVEAAATEAEREELLRRYEERKQDIDDITARMNEKVEDIVQHALDKSEQNRDLLLKSPAPSATEQAKLPK